MKNIKTWYLPDWDTHFESHLTLENNSYEYQNAQRQYAFSYIKNFNTNAIDVGSNVGFWSKDMCKKFKHVYAFEPLSDNIECFKKNLEEYKNYTVYNKAVSNISGTDMNFYVSPDECGNASLDNFGVQEATTNRKLNKKQLKVFKVNVEKIDNYNFENIGFIKVDCQGFEKEVILGTIETIQRCKPILCLELPARTDKERIYRENMINYLLNFNYHFKGHLRKENIFVYENTKG